jgi:hypothetical protein
MLSAMPAWYQAAVALVMLAGAGTCVYGAVDWWRSRREAS